MSALSANGVIVSIGGGTCYARSASANSTMSVEGVRVLGKALAQGTVPSGPMETTANVEYYIMGGDPGWAIVQSIMNNPTVYAGSTIKIGGASITKAYLTSFSVTAEPEGLVTASVSFVSYEKQQQLVIGSASAPGGQPGNLAFAHGQGSNAGGSNSVGFSAEASFEWEPLLTMGAQGQPQPQYLFNGGSVSLTIRNAGGGGSVSYCLTNGQATATAGTVCGGGAGQAYSVAGQITAAEVSAEVGGFAEGGFTVTRTL